MHATAYRFVCALFAFAACAANAHAGRAGTDAFSA